MNNGYGRRSWVTALAVALSLASTVAAAAQETDGRWTAFYGSWEPVDETVDRGVLCVRPEAGGVELYTVVDGIITTSDAKVAEKARSMRSHGQSERYLHESLGYNYRMTDITAAIGICQLKKIYEATQRRIANAMFLTKAIQQIEGLVPPAIAPERTHVFHQYTIRITDDFELSRDALKDKLLQKGIITGIYYPLPIYQQPLYQKRGYNDHLPVSEKAVREVLSLPVHPRVSELDLEFIVQGLRDV